MALFNYILYQAHPRPPHSLGAKRVSWVTSLSSEAAMFLGLLNHTLTWNRLQQFLHNSFFYFPHSYY